MLLCVIDTLIPAPEDAVTYNIVIDSVAISATLSGAVTCSLQCHVNKTEGSVLTENVRAGTVSGRLSTDNAWRTLTLSNGYWNDNGVFTRTLSQVPSTLVLRYILSNKVLATIIIPISKQGETGATGPGYYPAGEYESKEYTKTSKACPVVHYKDGSTDEYWYLDAPTNMVNGVPVAPSDVSGNPWKIADSFGVVLTNAVFAQFANMGGFVINGDYWYSKYGYLLYNNNGTVFTTRINASNVGTLFGGAVAYTYLDTNDPVCDNNPSVGEYKFRPIKVINAVSGEEYMAAGKIRVNARGTVVFSEDVKVRALETLSSSGGVRVQIENGIMQVIGLSGVANWRFGVDVDGNAILAYYNNAGQKLYDLGPNGISMIDNVAESFAQKTDLSTLVEGNANYHYTFKAWGHDDANRLMSDATIVRKIFASSARLTNTIYVYTAAKTRVAGNIIYHGGTEGGTTYKAKDSNIAKYADGGWFRSQSNLTGIPAGSSQATVDAAKVKCIAIGSNAIAQRIDATSMGDDRWQDFLDEYYDPADYPASGIGHFNPNNTSSVYMAEVYIVKGNGVVEGKVLLSNSLYS